MNNNNNDEGLLDRRSITLAQEDYRDRDTAARLNASWFPIVSNDNVSVVHRIGYEASSREEDSQLEPTKCNIALETSLMGLQWVGWQWAVFLTEESTKAIGATNWRDTVAIVAIASNEILGCQISGRVLSKVTKGYELDPAFPKNWGNTRYIKMALASVVSGITFDFIDRAVLASCTNAGYSDATTLGIRCFSVWIADRITYNLSCELFDRIKLDEWGHNLSSNAQASITPGTAAIGYNLGAALADCICEASGIKNKWVINLVRAPFIFLGTVLSSSVAYIEKTIWKCFKKCCSQQPI